MNGNLKKCLKDSITDTETAPTIKVKRFRSDNKLEQSNIELQYCNRLQESVPKPTGI